MAPVCLYLDNMVEDMDVDLDKEFLQELKELKVLITDKDLLDQHKRYKHLCLDGKSSTLFVFLTFRSALHCSVWSALLSEGKQRLLMRWRLISRWETLHPLVSHPQCNLVIVFRPRDLHLLQNLSRGLVNIATKLTNTKDVRDFFIDLVEKVSSFFFRFNLCGSKE